MEGAEVTIFGSLISLLLGILSVIGNSMRREMHEFRKIVDDHGKQLSSITTTLKHFERRSDLFKED